ncbi:hypothetical protein D3C72_2458040 [compost metagenome]
MSIASTAASGLFSAASAALVEARMKRFTRSGFSVSRFLLVMIPELIWFTPESAKRIGVTGLPVASCSLMAWSIT